MNLQLFNLIFRNFRLLHPLFVIVTSPPRNPPKGTALVALQFPQPLVSLAFLFPPFRHTFPLLASSSSNFAKRKQLSYSEISLMSAKELGSREIYCHFRCGASIVSASFAISLSSFFYFFQIITFNTLAFHRIIYTKRHENLIRKIIWESRIFVESLCLET